MNNLKVGDRIRSAISKVGTNGDPIIIHNGLVIFLKNLKEFQMNQIVTVKITAVKEKFATAEKIK